MKCAVLWKQTNKTGKAAVLAGVTDWCADLLLHDKKTFHGDEIGFPRARPGLPTWELTPPRIPARSHPPDGSSDLEGRQSEEDGSWVKGAWVSSPLTLCGTPGTGAHPHPRPLVGSFGAETLLLSIGEFTTLPGVLRNSL